MIYMDNQEKENSFANPFSENFMETASKFWENSFKLQTDAVESMSGFMDYFKTESSRSKMDHFFKMGSSINKFALSFFSNPKNLSGFAGASEVIPVLTMNLANRLTAAFADIQNMVADKSSKMGKNIKKLNMDDFNAGIFTIWKELYHSDFQKFYNIPQLGIARNYQEQMNTAMDTGNQFFMAFSEFMNLLLVPVEKAGVSVMETYQEMVDNNQLSDDPKAIYKLWIKTLEGFYMQLLQSPEYSRALNDVINTHAAYKKSHGQILKAFLQTFDIPTNSEMDELYKEIYQLKKKIRGLEKKSISMEKIVEKKNTRTRRTIKAGTKKATAAAGTTKKTTAKTTSGTAKKKAGAVTRKTQTRTRTAKTTTAKTEQ